MTPGGPYRITTNRDFDEYLDQFLTLAKSMGAFDRVRRAIGEIVRHLEISPVPWGDPVRRLEALGLTVFHRIYDALSVVYAVHDTDGFVWWTGLDPVLNHPLKTENEDLS